MHLCGEPLDLKDLLLEAADNGHLECLKYVHKKDVLGTERLVLLLPEEVTSSV